MTAAYDVDGQRLVLGQMVEILPMYQVSPLTVVCGEHQRVYGQRRRILDLSMGTPMHGYSIQVFGLRERFYLWARFARAVKYVGLRGLVFRYQLESAADQCLVNT